MVEGPAMKVNGRCTPRRLYIISRKLSGEPDKNYRGTEIEKSPRDSQDHDLAKQKVKY